MICDISDGRSVKNEHIPTMVISHAAQDSTFKENADIGQTSCRVRTSLSICRVKDIDVCI